MSVQPAPPAPHFPSVAPAQQNAAPPPASPETTQGLRAALSTRRFPLWVLLALIGVTAVFSAATVVAVVVGVGLLREDGATGGEVRALLAGGQQTIARGQSVSGTLQVGRSLDYGLHVDRGGPVNISLTGDFDCYLRVLRNGVVMFEDDDGGGGLNSLVSATLVPGDYVVQVGSFQNAAGGSFVLSVQ
jgi:anti-sigma factor RsiW